MEGGKVRDRLRKINRTAYRAPPWFIFDRVADNSVNFAGLMALIKKSKQKRIQEIDLALNELRPHLAVDGGNVEVLDYTDDMTVKIKWLGNCESCSMSAFTLRAGIEQAIKSRFPEVLAVIAVNS